MLINRKREIFSLTLLTIEVVLNCSVNDFHFLIIWTSAMGIFIYDKPGIVDTAGSRYTFIAVVCSSETMFFKKN